MIRELTVACCLIALASLLAAEVPVAQQTAAPLDVVQVRPNFHLIAGAGGNVAVQTGGDGVVVVDTGDAARSGEILEAIRRITKAPIRFVFNTSADADHVGGNQALLRDAQASFEPVVNLFPRNYFVSGPVAILATEAVLRRMSAPSGQTSPFPVAAWPTETFERGRRYVYLNDDGIEAIHHPAAHTDGDASIFFRRSDVLVTGDIVDMTRFPLIDRARGGSLQGTIEALNRLIATAIPSVPDVSREVGTVVVPGHGRVGDQFDLLNYRDMLVIIRDHVQDLIKQGRTLEQIKAAGPAKGFVGRYGSPDRLIEAIYYSLASTTS